MSRLPRFLFAILIAASAGAGAKELLIHRELRNLPPPAVLTAELPFGPTHAPPPRPAPPPAYEPGAL
jgi:hypothetical protein